MKSYFFLLIICLSGATVFAQQQDTGSVAATPPTVVNANPLVTLASKFFERDFFNVFANASGVYDAFSAGQNGTGNSFGFSVGGGINGFHTFRDGNLSLSYAGNYSNYRSTFLSSGTNQNLAFGYTKRLARRWNLGLSAGGGIFLYGGSFFTSQPNTNNTVVTNPFAPETRFLSTGLTFTYQQTRRLSYSFGGSYYLQRYNGINAIGTTGGSGFLGVNYRLSARTTVSGNYTYGYYVYQHDAGNSAINGVSLSVAHQFPYHWMLSVYGGYNRSHSKGIIQLPVQLPVSLGGGTVYVLGQYDQVAYVPSFGATLSHNYRHSFLSFSIGQGTLASGNGLYLASKNQYLNGVYSYNLRGSSLSVGGSFYRLSSLANAVASNYSSGGLSASYSRNLVRYVGTFVRYDFNRYGSLGSYAGTWDNRISFGISFSSKSIPLTLF